MYDSFIQSLNVKVYDPMLKWQIFTPSLQVFYNDESQSSGGDESEVSTKTM